MESTGLDENSFSKLRGEMFKDNNTMHQELDLLQSKIAALENKLKKNSYTNLSQKAKIECNPILSQIDTNIKEECSGILESKSDRHIELSSYKRDYDSEKNKPKDEFDSDNIDEIMKARIKRYDEYIKPKTESNDGSSERYYKFLQTKVDSENNNEYLKNINKENELQLDHKNDINSNRDRPERIFKSGINDIQTAESNISKKPERYTEELYETQNVKSSLDELDRDKVPIDYKTNTESGIYHEILEDIYKKRVSDNVISTKNPPIEQPEDQNLLGNEYSWSSHESKDKITNALMRNNSEQCVGNTKLFKTNCKNKTLSRMPNIKNVKSEVKEIKTANSKVKKEGKENCAKQKSSYNDKPTVERKMSSNKLVAKPHPCIGKEKAKNNFNRNKSQATVGSQNLWKVKYEKLKTKYMKIYSDYNDLAENYKLSEQTRKLQAKQLKKLEKKTKPSEMSEAGISVNIKKKHTKCN